jgi:hypothetical protein
MSTELLHDLSLTPRQIVGLFLLCKGHENDLDLELEDLYTKLRYFLYEHLSIYQIENLETLYHEGDDFIEIEKGKKE